MDFSELGLLPARMLLPENDCKPEMWAVLACDQYSSQKDYWQGVAADVGDQPSTLHQIIPECYLEDDDLPNRVMRASSAMREYAADATLHLWPEGTVLVERNINGKIRQGMMMAIDLERYDYTLGAEALIRPTEGTIVDRIPPRLQLRREASIEYPHIMILIDDPDQTVIEPLMEKTGLETVYDFTLGWGGGPIRGRFLPHTGLTEAKEALSALYTQSQERYGKPFLMAVGDGNHSLATAKAFWEELKTQPNIKPDHPARYALAEIVNLHSEAIVFEPIHRVLFDVPDGGQERVEELIQIHVEAHTLELGSQQKAFDVYLQETPSARIDYIHGMENAKELASQPSTLLYPQEVIRKDGFFQAVAHNGVLPRKAFSMGEANDKRFYMEGRFIVTDVLRQMGRI